MFQPKLDPEIEASRVLFTYENMISRILLSDEPHDTFGSQIDPVKAFINFGYIGRNPAYKSVIKGVPGGWKLHVAICDTVVGNVARAWNAIKDILIEQRIAESKIIKPGVSFAHNLEQSGKQITIYQYYNPERDWDMIINQIEQRLRMAQILPATFSPTDKRISGSAYISYRNDLSRSGKQVLSASEVMPFPEDKRYNPFGYPDPFSSIVIKELPST